MKKKKTISAALATALALTCMGSGGGDCVRGASV